MTETRPTDKMPEGHRPEQIWPDVQTRRCQLLEQLLGVFDGRDMRAAEDAAQALADRHGGFWADSPTDPGHRLELSELADLFRTVGVFNLIEDRGAREDARIWRSRVAELRDAAAAPGRWDGLLTAGNPVTHSHGFMFIAHHGPYVAVHEGGDRPGTAVSLQVVAGSCGAVESEVYAELTADDVALLRRALDTVAPAGSEGE